MAGRKKTETVEAEVVETAVVPAGKMEFRLINPTEDGFLRRIQWNKEELEAAVRAKIAGYENVVYTEENIKAAKNDRAELNKLIKAIEERRKQVKNIINEPYAVFEAELKEITALINEPVALIDQQVKAFEEKQKEEKKAAIKAKVIATQANIHQDAEFSKSFMRKGVWKNEATGTDSVSVTSGQFIKFSNGNSDPIAFFQNKMTEINEETGRTPNRLGLGVNVYNALKEHPAILERVKYGGSTPNPAKVNLNVLAQLFEIDRIVLDRTVQNKAGLGQNADMGYIGDPNSFLLAYATDTPSVEEPSAGYIFTWDMLENGILLPILNYPGAPGTHSELVEGLMAYDMKKTADDLAFFGCDAV